MYLRSKLYLLYQKSEIPDAMKSMNEEIMLRNDNFVQNGSNLQISKIYYVSLAMTRFAPLAGSGFKELPEFLDLKRAIINMKNTDKNCFGYAILSALYPNQNNPQRAQRYIFHFGDAAFDTISYPIGPTDVPVIEELWNLKINILSFEDDCGNARYPLFVSMREPYRKEIDLLYSDGHSTWIKMFSAFIFDLNPKYSMKFFWKTCFEVFLTDTTQKRHLEICSRPDYDSVIYQFPTPGHKKSNLRIFRINSGHHSLLFLIWNVSWSHWPSIKLPPGIQNRNVMWRIVHAQLDSIFYLQLSQTINRNIILTRGHMGSSGFWKISSCVLLN